MAFTKTCKVKNLAMLSSDDTTTNSNSENDDDQILFLNGSQRRGNFVENKKPAKSIRRKPGSLAIPKQPFKDYAR
jgi:hypothetical protein